MNLEILLRFSRPLLASFALLAMGCASEPADDTVEEEDPGEYACELVEDDGTRISAAEVPGAAEELDPSETPYTIELIDGVPGYVTLRGGEDALLFVQHEDIVTGLFHQGDLDRDLLEDGTPNEFCEGQIPEHFDLELEESGNYYLQLGPAAVDEVWLVYIGTNGHAHGD